MRYRRRNFLCSAGALSSALLSGCTRVSNANEKYTIGEVKIGDVHKIKRVDTNKISIYKSGERLEVDNGFFTPDWVIGEEEALKARARPNDLIWEVLYWYNVQQLVANEGLFERSIEVFKRHIPIAKELRRINNDVAQLRRGLEREFFDKPVISDVIDLINELRRRDIYETALKYSDTLSNLEELANTMGNVPEKIEKGVHSYLERDPNVHLLIDTFEGIRGDGLFDFSNDLAHILGTPERPFPDAEFATKYYSRALISIQSLIENMENLCKSVNSDIRWAPFDSNFGTSPTFYILGKAFEELRDEFLVNYVTDIKNTSRTMDLENRVSDGRVLSVFPD